MSARHCLLPRGLVGASEMLPAAGMSALGVARRLWADQEGAVATVPERAARAAGCGMQQDCGGV